MTLKVGDKLLCKKDDIDFYESPKNYKDEYYTIVEIDDTFCAVGNLGYFKNKYSDWYIWKYFYTPQEMRKLKLERLKQLMK